MDKEQKEKKQLSIIVLEDNDGDYVLLEDYLIEAYKAIEIHRFETFDDFKKFKETTDDFKYDIILLDLNLHDISGIELIEKVLFTKLHAPVIILTGYSDLTLAKESLKLGVEDFLIKDEISSVILHKSIEFALSRSQYIKHIQAQNDKLSNIAWTQSHIVRAPLARILGIINLLEAEKGNMDDLMFWLNQLRISSNEMDEIVTKIIEDAQEINLKKDNE